MVESPTDGRKVKQQTSYDFNVAIIGSTLGYWTILNASLYPSNADAPDALQTCPNCVRLFG